MHRRGAILATALGLIASMTSAQNATATNCSSSLHIIVARGSAEPPGTGLMGGVASNISALISGSEIVALDYPAAFDAYFTSEPSGVAALSNALSTYVSACPDGKIALLGYSQGAQVTADVLCGTTDGQAFNATAPLDTSKGKNIVAVVMFGDPSHVPGLPWDAGTSKGHGLFGRQNTSACDPYAGRMRSWCDTGDIYCDGGNDRAVHRSYFANYTKDAANFVLQKYNETVPTSGGNATATTTGGSPTPSGTSSTSTPTQSKPGNAASRISFSSIGYFVLGAAMIMSLI